MPTDISVNVLKSTPSYAGGTKPQVIGDRYGNMMVNEFRGRLGEANARGNLFHFCTLVAGVTLPLFTATAQTYGLRNPAGSGVVLELCKLELGYLSGTQVPGSLVFCQSPVGSDIIATGTGGTTAATQTAGLSGQYGGSGAISQCRMITAATVVAPTVILRTLGLSTYTMPATNATQGVTYTGYEFHGTDLLFPGQIIYLACTVAAAAGVNVVNVSALELPLSIA